MSDLRFSLQSDHYMVLFSITTENLKPQIKKASKQIFNYVAGDWDNMNHYLFSYNFNPCLTSENVEFTWDYIKTAILKGSNLFIPKISLKPRKQPVWFNSVIRHKLHCIHTLRWNILNIPQSIIKQSLIKLKLICSNLWSRRKIIMKHSLSTTILTLTITKYFIIYLL